MVSFRHFVLSVFKNRVLIHERFFTTPGGHPSNNIYCSIRLRLKVAVSVYITSVSPPPRFVLLSINVIGIIYSGYLIKRQRYTIVGLKMCIIEKNKNLRYYLQIPPPVRAALTSRRSQSTPAAAAIVSDVKDTLILSRTCFQIFFLPPPLLFRTHAQICIYHIYI